MVSTITQLQRIKGLELVTDSGLAADHLKGNDSNQLVEAEVSASSSLLHTKIRDTDFQDKYHASIIAVCHDGGRVSEDKAGNIRLQSGDVLLLCGAGFERTRKTLRDFTIITPLADNLVTHRGYQKGWVALLLLTVMILLVSLNVLPIFLALASTTILLFAIRAVTTRSAIKSINFNVLLLVASTFGIGTAMQNSGAADWIARQIVRIGEPMGLLALLCLLYLMTTALTEILSNTAAAAIMFPIALELADKVNQSPMGFIVAITIAASAAFATPIGYQTNMIVYGPGGYRFTDYLKVGFPLNLICLTVSVSIIYFVWMT
jgi:di/tricarboxylate transporter